MFYNIEACTYVLVDYMQSLISRMQYHCIVLEQLGSCNTFNLAFNRFWHLNKRLMTSLLFVDCILRILSLPNNRFVFNTSIYQRLFYNNPTLKHLYRKING